MNQHEPPVLSSDALSALRELVERMERHEGPWGTVEGFEETAPNTFTMPYVVKDDLAEEALSFLYNQDLIISFAWPEWDEGRELFRSPESDRFAKLDRQTTLKLLTAVARNDRFNEGAWVAIFEDGSAQQLFKRLLEIEVEQTTREEQ